MAFWFWIKQLINGSINCYEAWLVGIENKQEYSLDYDESFSVAHPAF